MKIRPAIFLAVIISSVPTLVCAQQTLHGTVKNKNQQAVSGAEIEIISLKKKVQSDDQGNFKIDSIASWPIALKISKEKYLELFTDAENAEPLQIFLHKDSLMTIETVNLKASKPVLKKKIDRLEFNIENTPLQNLSAWDILKNTPGVLLKNDELSVRGSTQIVVTINDKRTLMTGEQLKQLLENTEGNNVSSVEVITNPPAKYDAQGGAVINIRMKKNVLSGYKARLSSRYTQATYARGLAGFAQSYNNKKWQLTSNYSFSAGDFVRYNFDVVTFYQQKTRWESDLVRKTNSREQHVYTFSGRYEIDSLSSVQFGFDGSNAPKNFGQYSVPTNIYNTETQNVESCFLTSNERLTYNNSINAFAAYDKKWKRSNLTFTQNTSIRHFRENQDVKTLLNFKNQPQNHDRFASRNIQDISLYSAQADYRYTNKDLIIESGLKYSTVKNVNTLGFFEEITGNLQPVPAKSNGFNYLENIAAAYISTSYKWKKWETKAGLRSETTSINSGSDNPEISSKTLRTGLFPTLFLMYSFEDGQQLGFSYGKRIERPNYSFLNPSKSYYNLYSYFQGDAALKSAIIHNLSLSCTVKNWNFETYASYTKDPSMEISLQNPETFETVYRFTNIDHNKNLGINVSKVFTLLPSWKINFFGMGEFQENYFFGTDQMLYRNSVFFYNTNISTQITLDKAKTWDLNLSYVYNSKTIQGSFDISASQRTTLIINKKMLNNRLEAALVLNDIFRTDRNTISTRYADQNQFFKDYRDSRNFVFTLRYNFGNQKVKDAKSGNKTDEQNRL
ncbi:hypothetical protein ASG01_14345 [Chryseobacterium sp. Leaf180]|uniref:outer membrane beta-barrel family protein n=1 Tax=Chryseobacterium sp. Leaf180 TaxID=1736289 RepID=UPI000700EC6E|nr:outer membrane beta-barrel family protein [Chryseobacterium sp. Leaf180]KQR91066.1 hypothetical protein ASG01_14345 [Chryseobacterium sp. Leaf180]